MAIQPAIRKRVRKTGARGTVMSSRTVKSSGQEQEKVSETNKEIQSVIKDPNPGYVTVNGGLTKNLGNFNSAKVAVSVSLPCEPTKKGIHKTYKEASALVEEFMDAEYKLAIGESDGE